MIFSEQVIGNGFYPYIAIIKKQVMNSSPVFL